MLLLKALHGQGQASGFTCLKKVPDPNSQPRNMEHASRAVAAWVEQTQQAPSSSALALHAPLEEGVGLPSAVRAVRDSRLLLAVRGN